MSVFAVIVHEVTMKVSRRAALIGGGAVALTTGAAVSVPLAPEELKNATRRALGRPAVVDYFYTPDRDQSLPSALILGDSISMHYTLQVRRLLKGKFNVERAPANCRDSSQLLKNLALWTAGQFDVVHFNTGLHDLKFVKPDSVHGDDADLVETPTAGKQWTSLVQYRANLHAITSYLKDRFGKIIFATTTPIPAGAKGRMPGDAAEFNSVAVTVMKDHDIPVNDLNSFISPLLAGVQNPRNVHFNEIGQALLAWRVADAIMRTYSRRPPQ